MAEREIRAVSRFFSSSKAGCSRIEHPELQSLDLYDILVTGVGGAFVEADGYGFIDDARQRPWVTRMLCGKVRGREMRSCGVFSLHWLANLLRPTKPRRHPANEYVVYQDAVGLAQLERVMEITRSASEGFQGWREPILWLSKC